jgi:hypothetical protein
MSLRIVLRPEADADLMQARDWYEHEGSGLADAFADTFEEMIVRIEAMPELYAVALRNIRRGKLRRSLILFTTECSPIGSKFWAYCTGAKIRASGKNELI